MSIESDIGELEELSRKLGSSQIAIDLARAFVQQLRASKEKNGPQNRSGNLALGIFKMSQPMGASGHYSVGVGDLKILGTPDEQPPRGTIRAFLDSTRAMYQEQKQRTTERVLEKHRQHEEQRNIAKLGKKEAKAAREKEMRRQKRAQRREMAIRTATYTERRRVENLEQNIKNLEEETRAVRNAAKKNAAEGKRISDRRSKLNKQVKNFEEKYGVTIDFTPKHNRYGLVEEFSKSEERLHGFLQKYTEISGKKRETYQRLSKIDHSEYDPSMNKYVTAYKPFDAKRYRTAKNLRKSIRTFLSRSKKFETTTSQLDTLTERMGLLKQRLEDARTELSAKQTSLRNKKKKSR